MNDYTKLIILIRATPSRDNRTLLDDAADAIERLQKERDEAVRDIKKYSSNCKTCLHGNNGENDCLEFKFAPCNWEWRGVKDE